MATTPTDFQRPDFDLEYEEAETPGKKIILTSEGDACCACNAGNTSVCATENDMSFALGASAGFVGAFWFK